MAMTLQEAQRNALWRPSSPAPGACAARKAKQHIPTKAEITMTFCGPLSVGSLSTSDSAAQATKVTNGQHDLGMARLEMGWINHNSQASTPQRTVRNPRPVIG